MEDTIQYNEVEIKKDLYKSKEMANFSHYEKGRLFYNVEIFGSTFQFPIHTVEPIHFEIKVADTVSTGTIKDQYKLSADLGDTPFGNQVKGSELIRWIAKAIKNNEFIKISL